MLTIYVYIFLNDQQWLFLEVGLQDLGRGSANEEGLSLFILY